MCRLLQNRRESQLPESGMPVTVSIPFSVCSVSSKPVAAAAVCSTAESLTVTAKTLLIQGTAEVCQAKTDILQQSPCVAFTIFTVFPVFAVFTVFPVFPEGRYHYICSDMRYYLRQIPTAVLYFHCRKDPVRDPGLIRRESPHRDHPQSLL